MSSRTSPVNRPRDRNVVVATRLVTLSPFLLCAPTKSRIAKTRCFGGSTDRWGREQAFPVLSSEWRRTCSTKLPMTRRFAHCCCHDLVSGRCGACSLVAATVGGRGQPPRGDRCLYRAIGDRFGRGASSRPFHFPAQELLGSWRSGAGRHPARRRPTPSPLQTAAGRPASPPS